LFTGFHTRIGRDRRSRPGATLAIAALCLALLALFTVVQVVHEHAVASDADHCALCVAMHTAVPVAAAAPVITLVQVEAAAPVLEVRAIVRHWRPQLFIRPPPAGC